MMQAISLVRNLLILVLALVFMLGAWPLVSSSAMAQSPPVTPPVTDPNWQFRYDLFQLLLEEYGLETTEYPTEPLASPADSLIVIATSSKFGVSQTDLLKYVQAGGAILLARELSNLSIVQSRSYDIGSFYHGPVSTNNPAEQYKNFADCISITAIDDPEQILQDVGTIIVNRSSWYVPPTNSILRWHILARYSNTVQPLASRGAAVLALGQTTDDRAGSGRRGLMLVSADDSLFTNGMMWHGDNAMLAVRVAELLSRDRKRVVFLVDGQTQPSAKEQLAQQLRDEQAKRDALARPPEPSLQRLLRLSNAMLKEVGNSNVLNDLLKQQPRSVSPWRYFNFLLRLAVVACLLWLLFKVATSSTLRTMLMARRRMRPAFEMMPGSSGGDYRNSAGYLAREFCTQWTGSNQSSDWQQTLALLLARDNRIQPTDKQDLVRIVDIACRGCHEKMNVDNFQKFGQTIARLRGRHAAFRLA